MQYNSSFDQHFGNVLLERGLCEESAIKEALELQTQQIKSGNQQELGDVLVALGKISAEQMKLVQITLKKNKAVVINIPGYKLLHRISKHGPAMTFAALQESVDRKVIIRLVAKGSKSEPAMEKFRHDAKLLARLNHPSISNAIDMGENESCLYLVLHKHRGLTLREHITTHGPLDNNLLISITADIVDALEHMEAKCLFHGNICPGNIIITDSGKAIITGFDFIKEAGKDNSKPAEAKSFYPEPVRHSRLHPINQDLYALGMTLFYAAVGIEVFETQDAVNEQKIPNPCEYKKVLNTKIAAIIYLLINSQSFEYYQSTKELKKELDNIISGKELEYTPLLPGAWGTILCFRTWPTTSAGRSLLKVSSFLLAILCAFLFTAYLNKDLFIKPSATPDLLKYPHWQSENIQLGKRADTSYELWRKARLSYGKSEPEQARQFIRNLLTNYPYSAYAGYAKELLNSSN